MNGSEWTKSAKTVRLILFYYSGVVIYNIFLSFISGIVPLMLGMNPFAYAFATFATVGYLGAVWFHTRFHEHEFIFYSNLGLSKNMLFAGAGCINLLLVCGLIPVAVIMGLV